MEYAIYFDKYHIQIENINELETVLDLYLPKKLKTVINHTQTIYKKYTTILRALI